VPRFVRVSSVVKKAPFRPEEERTTGTTSVDECVVGVVLAGKRRRPAPSAAWP
jgi:hypothetical protein